jgi:hypothetical protein
VNAKNRFGAYSGWKPFYVVFEKSGKIDGAQIVGEGDSRVLLEALCNSWDYNITSPE